MRGTRVDRSLRVPVRVTDPPGRGDASQTVSDTRKEPGNARITPDTEL